MGVVVNFNANQVDPSVQPEPLDTGRYPVAIINSEEKDTRDKKGSFIEITNQVVSGPMMGKQIKDRLNTRNENTEATRIAWAQLSAICHVTGRLTIGSTQELHGIPYMIDVIKVPRNDKPGAFSNEITGYYDAGGKAPTKGQPGGAAAGGAASSEWDSGNTATTTTQAETQQAATIVTGQTDIEAEIRKKVEAEMKLKAEIEAKVRADMAAKSGGQQQTTTTTTETAAASTGDGSVPDWAK